MIVSKLVFERIGERADAFFWTDHTTFLKFPNGDIFTFTRYEMRGAPLGLAGAPFSRVEWVLVENGSILTDLGKFSKFEVFDPKVEKITVRSGFEKYLALLREKLDHRTMERLLDILENGDFEKLVGFGPGLTPLGDDILSGMVVAGLEIDFPLRTSEISRQQMIHAIHRYVPYPVKVFLENGDDSLIIDMGATSGLGWALGVTIFLEWRGENGSLHSR